jgi:hypothetical protein
LELRIYTIYSPPEQDSVRLIPNCSFYLQRYLINGTIAAERIGKAAQTIVHQWEESYAKQSGLPINDKKVAMLTRRHIIELNITGLEMSKEELGLK